MPAPGGPGTEPMSKDRALIAGQSATRRNLA
jgi:hypothetical protein